MPLLQIHPEDNVWVALRDFSSGEVVEGPDGSRLQLLDDLPAKHKTSARELSAGEPVRMYGLVVGTTRDSLARGRRLSVQNVAPASEPYQASHSQRVWLPPDVAGWRDRRFDGIVRDDGQVGTRNYWVVAPLVFCENRNLDVMRQALLEELGYAVAADYRRFVRRLVGRDWSHTEAHAEQLGASRPFPNVDGVKFLTHAGGCGGGYEDALNLCRLLAGYLDHPNVAGATVLSLGCQKSQIRDLELALHQRNRRFNKPVAMFEHQAIGSEQTLMERALTHVVEGVSDANRIRREPVELRHLSVGLECGGSDGFSGI
ncbi:MAG: UxaA family hydrolase, partial [Planctomycetales bacterium]|nr:UxaA family hydrolase [Planctomycetales bacterium]